MVRLLLVDNGSRHIAELLDAVRGLGVDFDHLKYNQVPQDLVEYETFVLSGRVGGGILVDRNNLRVLEHAVAEKKNLLGICYGAHIMALCFGGTLGRLNAMRAETYEVDTESFFGPGQERATISVYSSHRYVISELPANLEILGHSTEYPYEIIHLEDSLIYGTQFHPEKTSDGLRFFNFLMGSFRRSKP